MFVILLVWVLHWTFQNQFLPLWNCWSDAPDKCPIFKDSVHVRQADLLCVTWGFPNLFKPSASHLQKHLMWVFRSIFSAFPVFQVFKISFYRHLKAFFPTRGLEDSITAEQKSPANNPNVSFGRYWPLIATSLGFCWLIAMVFTVFTFSPQRVVRLETGSSNPAG